MSETDSDDTLFALTRKRSKLLLDGTWLLLIVEKHAVIVHGSGRQARYFGAAAEVVFPHQPNCLRNKRFIIGCQPNLHLTQTIGPNPYASGGICSVTDHRPVSEHSCLSR